MNEFKYDECLDIDLSKVIDSARGVRPVTQKEAIEAHCHSKTSKITDYVVYKMPLGVWVAVYVVIALIVVSLLS